MASTTASAQTILLTGGAGVVGHALLPHLRGHRVVCLAHRTPAPGVECVRGDLTRVDLGLPPEVYRRLVGSVTCVIHSAAVTDLGDPDVERVNVVGTRRVCELVKQSGAHLVHLSSALAGVAPGPRDAMPSRYLASKRAAETVVRAQAPQAAIARPSVVVGDSRTGWTSRYQAVYQVAGSVLTGRLPVVPASGTRILDLVPQDLVGRSLARLVDGSGGGRVHVLATGAASLTLSEAADVLVAMARAAGRPVAAPRFDEDEGDGDEGHPPLAAATWPTAARLVAALTLDRPLPTSLPVLLGDDEAPAPADVLRRCMSRWARDRALPGFAVPSDREVADDRALA